MVNPLTGLLGVSAFSGTACTQGLAVKAKENDSLQQMLEQLAN